MTLSGTVVSNTGPIIALASIDQLELLRSIFDSVIVPDLVHAEILQGGMSRTGTLSYQQADWIGTASSIQPSDPLLQTVLDAGEAAAIQVALTAKADYVLIDERKGRKIARSVYQLNVIGTARILVEAKQRGILRHVGEAMANMRHAGYWIHDDIVEAARTIAGET